MTSVFSDFQSQGGFLHLCSSSPACNRFLRFTSGATFAALLVANVASGGSTELNFGYPPRGPNSINFMQFLGNFGKIVCWWPPGGWHSHLWEILDLPLMAVESFCFIYKHRSSSSGSSVLLPHSM